MTRIAFIYLTKEGLKSSMPGTGQQVRTCDQVLKDRRTWINRTPNGAMRFTNGRGETKMDKHEIQVTPEHIIIRRQNAEYAKKIITDILTAVASDLREAIARQINAGSEIDGDAAYRFALDAVVESITKAVNNPSVK